MYHSQWRAQNSYLFRVLLNLKMSETRILISLLWMYFPQNWKFGSALSKLWNFGWGLTPPGTPLITATGNT
jgi:hypothetical protein